MPPKPRFNAAKVTQAFVLIVGVVVAGLVLAYR